MPALDNPGLRSYWLEHVCGAGESLWFKGNPPFESQTRHMFFVLGTLSDGRFLMVNATSKMEKNLFHLTREVTMFGLTGEDVSVCLGPGEYPFIQKHTIINCLELHSLSAKQILAGDEFELFSEPPGTEFFVPLLEAWSNSPRTAPRVVADVRRQWEPLGVTF